MAIVKSTFPKIVGIVLMLLVWKFDLYAAAAIAMTFIILFIIWRIMRHKAIAKGQASITFRKYLGNLPGIVSHAIREANDTMSGTPEEVKRKLVAEADKAELDAKISRLNVGIYEMDLRRKLINDALDCLDAGIICSKAKGDAYKEMLSRYNSNMTEEAFNVAWAKHVAAKSNKP